MKRRDDVLAFIKHFSEENGYSPTQREIAAALHLAVSTVNHHVNSLIAEGALRGVASKPRTLRAVRG